MLTMKARYAIRALTALAKYPSGTMVLTSDLASTEGIPLRFLEGILLELRQRGILQSRKGRGGGFALLVQADQITVEAVVTAMNGPLAADPCIDAQLRRTCDGCRSMSSCRIHFLIARVNGAVAQVLRGVTIAELASHEENVL